LETEDATPNAITIHVILIKTTASLWNKNYLFYF
jgi:hypothetical protein